AETEVEDAAPVRVARARPDAPALARLRDLLAAAERPLAIVGEGGWSAAAARDVIAFAEANAVPVATSFRCQDYVDNRSAVYAGHLTIGLDPKLAARVQEADLIVAVRGRLGDVPTRGFTLIST